MTVSRSSLAQCPISLPPFFVVLLHNTGGLRAFLMAPRFLLHVLSYRAVCKELCKVLGKSVLRDRMPHSK